MRSVVLVLLLGGAVAIFGQGCGPSCESSAPFEWKACPNDPNPQPGTVASCKAAQASTCSGSYNDWVSCMVEKTKCDPNTKMSDPATKLQARADCEPKRQTFCTCNGPGGYC